MRASKRELNQQWGALANKLGTIVEDIVIGDLNDLTANVEYSYRMTLPRWARRVKDLLLFRIPWSAPQVDLASLASQQRTLPMQVRNRSRLYERMEIRLPAEFTPYGLPYEANLECPLAKYACRIEHREGTLYCQRTIEFHSNVVPASEFEAVRAYWEAAVRSDEADVVLLRGEGKGIVSDE